MENYRLEPKLPYSSRELVYRVYKGEAPVESLRILSKETYIGPELTITFYALGASHAMCVRSDTGAITEVLSCGSDRLSTELVAESASISGYILDLDADGIRIHARIDILPLSDLSTFANWGKPDGTIEQAYPDGDSDSPAWTRMRWSAFDGGATLETQHTYPGENVWVRSRTRIIAIS